MPAKKVADKPVEQAEEKVEEAKKAAPKKAPNAASKKETKKAPKAAPKKESKKAEEKKEVAAEAAPAAPVRAKKPYPTREERLAKIDAQIEAAQKYVERFSSKIEKLNAKKERLLNPPKKAKKATANKLIAKAREMGLSDEEIAEKLGVELDK